MDAAAKGARRMGDVVSKWAALWLIAFGLLAPVCMLLALFVAGMD